MATLLIAVDILAENIDSCCWIYSINACDFGAHWPIFISSLSLNHVNASVHARLDQSKCVSMRCSGIPLSGYFKSFAAKLTAYLMLLSVKLPRQTSSQNEHKKSSIFFVFVQICTTRLPRALTGHPLSAPVMAL